jgi:hypothetical protein
MDSVASAHTDSFSSAENGANAARFTVFDWLGFLFGRRDSIVKAANSPGAVWIGFLFVLSAGFAREYDGAYLFREPWEFLAPLAASLATSAVLYLIVFLAVKLKGGQNLHFFSGYRTLLTFFWLTAPLAWIYAVPVERYFSPASAIQINLLFLAIVSLWRVLLITRALGDWLGADYAGMFLLVAFFAASVTLALNALTPTPIFSVMGGIRLSESESIILGVKFMTWFFGGITWIVLLVPAGWVVLSRKPNWDSSAAAKSSGVDWSFRWFAVAALVASGGLMTVTQDEQRNRFEVEQLFRGGDIRAAVEQMSQLTRNDFPPHWDPPPRRGFGEGQPQSDKVLLEVDRIDGPAWLRNIYMEKVETSLDDSISRAVDFGNDGEARALGVLSNYYRNERKDAEVENQLRSILATDDALSAGVRDRIADALGIPADEPELSDRDGQPDRNR